MGTEACPPYIASCFISGAWNNKSRYLYRTDPHPQPFSLLLDIPAAEIEPAPTFGAKIRADFIRGMGKVNGKFVIILDVDHVLSLDEMSSLTNDR